MLLVLKKWQGGIESLSGVVKSFETFTEGLGYIDSIEPFVILVEI